MAKYKYEYTCPQCGTYLEFKMRVTLTKRKCPQCGTEITPEEIDRQKEAEDRRQAEAMGRACILMVVGIAVGLILGLARCM